MILRRRQPLAEKKFSKSSASIEASPINLGQISEKGSHSVAHRTYRIATD